MRETQLDGGPKQVTKQPLRPPHRLLLTDHEASLLDRFLPAIARCAAMTRWTGLNARVTILRSLCRGARLHRASWLLLCCAALPPVAVQWAVWCRWGWDVVRGRDGPCIISAPVIDGVNLTAVDLKVPLLQVLRVYSPVAPLYTRCKSDGVHIFYASPSRVSTKLGACEIQFP